jgi:hypothetical protein
MRDVSHKISGSSRAGLGLRAEDKLRRARRLDVAGGNGRSTETYDRSQSDLEHKHSVRGRLIEVEDLTECSTRCMGSSCR